MNGWLLAAHRDESVEIHRSNTRGLEMAESLTDGEGAGERPLHRHLLVEQHADEQRGAVVAQQSICRWLTGDVKIALHLFTIVAGALGKEWVQSFRIQAVVGNGISNDLGLHLAGSRECVQRGNDHIGHVDFEVAT